jgi:ATP synthase protein I
MTTATPRQQPAMRVPGVGWALTVTVVVGLSAVLLAAVLGGSEQVLGALAGTALVAVFFLFGMVNTALAAAFAPRTALLVAMLTYTVQVVGLAILLVAVSRSEAAGESLDVRWLAGTVIVGALGWTVALVVDALRQPTEITSAEVGAR